LPPKGVIAPSTGPNQLKSFPSTSCDNNSHFSHPTCILFPVLLGLTRSKYLVSLYIIQTVDERSCTQYDQSLLSFTVLYGYFESKE